MRATLPLLLATLAASASASAEPVTYRLDPDNSFIHFEVLHFGTSTLRGRFGPVQGAVVLDRAAGRGEVGIRVPTATVSTGNPVFDARLRQGDLLASQAWPEAYFVASRFRFEGERLEEVRGEFTLRGTGRPLSLRAMHFACRTDTAPDGSGAAEVCGGDFEGEILRSDFGATFGLPFVGDLVRLRVQVEGRR